MAPAHSSLNGTLTSTLAFLLKVILCAPLVYQLSAAVWLLLRQYSLLLIFVKELISLECIIALIYEGPLSLSIRRISQHCVLRCFGKWIVLKFLL